MVFTRAAGPRLAFRFFRGPDSFVKRGFCFGLFFYRSILKKSRIRFPPEGSKNSPQKKKLAETSPFERAQPLQSSQKEHFLPEPRGSVII